MQIAAYEAPVLYGDHHVLEVRRILSELPGVQNVYASSAFQVIEVQFDEKVTNDLEIAKILDEAGYLGEWTLPIEVGARQQGEEEEKPFFRHTQTYESTKHVVSFGQTVSAGSRPLWPCPGMGPIRKMVDDE
ncbi:MAG: heavy-metal-associated domain-containing protein [Anaerolineales bacterium]|nr:heavy-metal-associated domain-containing protein [Anaerolineales bacterium]